MILASRSIYFEAQFSHDFTEKDTRIAHYKDVPYELFLMFLKHIYSDNVKIESRFIYDLLSVSFPKSNLVFLYSSQIDSPSQVSR